MEPQCDRRRDRRRLRSSSPRRLFPACQPPLPSPPPARTSAPRPAPPRSHRHGSARGPQNRHRGARPGGRATGAAAETERKGRGAPGRTLLCAPVCRITFRSSTLPTGTRDILWPPTAGTPGPGPLTGAAPRDCPAAARRKWCPRNASSRQRTAGPSRGQHGPGALRGWLRGRLRGCLRGRLRGCLRQRPAPPPSGQGGSAGAEQGCRRGRNARSVGRTGGAEGPHCAHLPLAVAKQRRRRRQPWRGPQWPRPRSSGRCWTRWPRAIPRPTAGSCGSSAPRPSGSAPRRSLACACGPGPRWVRGQEGASPPAAGLALGTGGGCGAGEGRRGLGRAQPRLGLLQDVVGGALFINICGWKRVPAPKAPTDPTPVRVGRLEEVSGEGGRASKCCSSAPG